MASGLWLSAKAAQELSENSTSLASFQQTLQDNGVLLTSLNGFPFGNFHQSVVKTKVYLPTWAEEIRLNYSKQLATILASCLPANADYAAISTLPLAYQDNWTPELHQQAITNFR